MRTLGSGPIAGVVIAVYCVAPAAAQPAPAVVPQPPVSVARNDCERYIADLSVPDGTRVDPGTNLNKAWRLENCGDTLWDNFQAVRVGGDYGPERFIVPRTEPGTSVDLSTQLRSPLTSGCHRTTYRVEGPRGQFGSGAFVEVVVVNGDAASPASEPNLDDPSTLVPLPTDLGEGWCTASVRVRSGDVTVMFHNSADSPAPRDAQIWLTQRDSADAAAPSVGGLLYALGPESAVDYGDWAIGDGTVLLRGALLILWLSSLRKFLQEIPD